MKYDVFISYSRRDYVDEHEVVKEDSPVKAILDFLDIHQINYWFDKDGVYSGSRFVEVIANAIADSKIMVFISSVHSNESIYTAGEIFEALENKLLLIPIKIDDSKYNKAFKLLLNPLDYIDFAKKDALCELLNAIKTEIDRLDKLEAEKIRLQEEKECKKKEEYEKLKLAERLKKEQEERLAKRNEILTDVRDLIVQIENHRLAQKNIIERVYSNLQCIDISHKSCPVCQTHCKLDSEYCPICGWHFATFSAIQELEIEQDESERNALTHYSATWENSKSASPKVSSEIKRLKEENKILLKELNDLKKASNENDEHSLDNNVDVPTDADLRKWNWGAFFFSWIWGFANGIKRESLISIVLTIPAGPVVNLYFAIYGTRLSWRYKQWSSWKSYQDAQKKWIYASYVFCCVFCCVFVLALILALILINI